MKVLVLASVLAVPAHARAGGGLPHHSLGLGFDGSEVDLGSGTASSFGVALLTAIGGGRFQLVGECAIGDLEGGDAVGDLGLYTRTSLGVRMLAATVSTDHDTNIALALDAGAGHASYFLDQVTVHRPALFAGWTLLVVAGRRHGLQMSYTLRLDASPRLDDAAALRAICRGTCPSGDEAPIDLTFSGVFGFSGW